MTSFNKVLASLINLLAQSGGREKICRFFQYFCKYLSTRYQNLYDIHVSQRNQIKIKLAKSDSLMGAMAMTRKILRFGPSLNAVRTIIVNIIELAKNENKESTHIVVLKTFSAFFLAVFFLCDHYIWLFRVKNVLCSALGWLLDCITTLIKNACLYFEMSQKQKKTQTIPLAIDSVRVICDMPVAYSFVKPGSVEGKLVGTLGSITSLIGVYQLWK